MSVSGPSQLNTLLATRLDAVLGTTLAQHPVLLEGFRTHAIAQAASALHPQDSVIKRGTGEVQERGGRIGPRAGDADATSRAGRDDARPGAQNSPAASARATLSEPARLILALLVSRQPAMPNAREGVPLWPRSQDANAAARYAARDGAGSGQQDSLRHAVAGQRSGTAVATGDPRGAGPQTTLAQTQASQSAAGRVLASTPFLGDSARAAPSSAPLTASNPMAQTLAATLAQAVASSGVFYESHLAKLAFGKTSFQSILREPQASLPSPRAADTRQPGQESQAGNSLGRWLGSPLGSTTDATPQSPTPRSDSNHVPVPGVHPDTTGLVRQQLETLANGQFSWHGEAWPDAHMDWEIGEEASTPESDEAKHWASTLRLHLPHLGEIEAKIHLSGNQVLLRLGAAESASTLQAAGGDLRARLLDAGLILRDLAVAPLEPPLEAR